MYDRNEYNNDVSTEWKYVKHEIVTRCHQQQGEQQSEGQSTQDGQVSVDLHWEVE